MGPNQWADAAAADGSMQPGLQQQQQQQHIEHQQQQVQAQQPPAHEDQLDQQLDRQMLRHLLKKWGPDGLARLMQEEETTNLSRRCWPFFFFPFVSHGFIFAAWLACGLVLVEFDACFRRIAQLFFANHDECRICGWTAREDLQVAV